MIGLMRQFVIPAALQLLPPAMSSPEAVAMLVAIGYQESRFEARLQRVAAGKTPPARGFWQFEKAGVNGVLADAGTGPVARQALVSLRYRRDLTVGNVHELIAHNDVLAAVFARLYLYQHPHHLPTRDQVADGWTQYVETWRPGSPHRHTWARAWHVAWTTSDLSPDDTGASTGEV